MYIWRRTPRWQPLRGTTLGEAPTVGSTARWGQVPDAAAHDSRNPSTVRQDPGAVGRGGSAGLYKGVEPLPSGPYSSLQTFGFQPFEALPYVSKFSPV
jgi:hypothetical protein